jgi:hypothetical protein
VFGLVVFVTAAVLVSCVKPDPEADKAAVQALVEQDSVWFSASTTVDSTGTGGSFDSDTSVLWWRGTQTHDNPQLEVEVVGDSAWVAWSRRNLGDFYVLANLPTDSLVLWTKKVVETAKLRGVFKREGRTNDDDRGWVLDRISLAYGRSDSSQTISIDSMRIVSATAGEQVIVDPLETFYGLDNLVWFTPGEQVTLELYTNAEEGVAFLHTFVLIWPFYVRVPLTYDGDGVFIGTWHAQRLPFPRFAIFDLMTRSTIFNPDAPYDFCGWLFPYTIKTAD